MRPGAAIDGDAVAPKHPPSLESQQKELIMTATETERRPATPEEIWEILRQVALRQKEKEKAEKEYRKKARKQMEELRAEGAENGAQSAPRRGSVHEPVGPFDGVASSKGTWWKLLQERNVEVEAVASRIRLSRDPKLREVDLFAANGEEAVAVEVKTTLKPEHVTDFVELLDELPRLFRGYRARRLYGAVAYLKADAGTIRYAMRKGLLVIRATGSSASIVNEPDFKPRLFGSPAAS